ncbi:MAG: DUF2127 domain-containing protein [Candidatus Kapaibacterium sp.]|nr:MAG: DUF2127 domain-containing protein [Candidatus Kapabacteria bacterium]
MHKNPYLRTIAIYKIIKGFGLLFIGVSLVFLESRELWMDALIQWMNDELMLPHGKIYTFLLHKLQEFLSSDSVKSTGILALVYAVVLWIEGVGVYFEQRWAEWFMVVATASLIPLEVYHLIHKPSIVKVLVVCANTAIVVYLWRMLRKKEEAEQVKTV